MILFADSGSTKTDWVCWDGQKTIRFQTIGMNPYFVTDELVFLEINRNLPKQVSAESVRKIYFYGSGCGREESQHIIMCALKKVFPNAEAYVASDLEGAAIACYGNGSGAVAILGTGMNIGYWDGNSLETPMPSLGYIFGDAGSGAVLGRKLVQAVFEKRISDELIAAFQNKYHLSVAELLDRVYKQPRPNTFLASFARFYSEHLKNAEIQSILHDAYREFATIYARPLADKYGIDAISFVGSVSLAFSDIISKELEAVELKIDTIIGSPLQKLKFFL